MDALLSTIQTARNLRDSTLKEYKRNLNKLAIFITGFDYDSKTFLIKDFQKIKEYLNGLATSTKKKMVSSILVALSPTGMNMVAEQDKEVYDQYKAILLAEQQIYNKSIAGNKKSEKDEANWTSWKSITDVNKSLKKQISAKGINMKTTELKEPLDLYKLQDYLISSLYTMLPPRRLDYADARVISFKDYNKLTNEDKHKSVYLVHKSNTNRFFHFGKDAVKSTTAEDVKVDVPKNLNTVITLWLKFNNGDFLLVSQDGGKLTTNALSKQITRIFKPTGKKISVVMLRKIFLSEEFNGDKNKKNDLAEKMNHSVAVQQSAYVKDI